MPAYDHTALAIERAYEKQGRGKPRAYIGASIIGNSCDAYLALSLRGFPDNEIKPQLKRIFGIGHVIEDMVVADLRKAGFQVWDKDPLTHRQFEYVDYGGHIKSHTDGQIEPHPHLPGFDTDEVAILEIKSMNDNKWREFQAKGVRVSHPRYFAQMQFMMGQGGIETCLMVSYNKNNSAYASEVVSFDEIFYSSLLARAELALRNEARRIAEDEADWRCRDCFKSAVCWGKTEPEKACRTCAHAVATPQGGWDCTKTGTPAAQLCGRYEQYAPKPRR